MWLVLRSRRASSHKPLPSESTLINKHTYHAFKRAVLARAFFIFRVLCVSVICASFLTNTISYTLTSKEPIKEWRSFVCWFKVIYNTKLNSSSSSAGSYTKKSLHIHTLTPMCAADAEEMIIKVSQF